MICLWWNWIKCQTRYRQIFDIGHRATIRIQSRETDVFLTGELELFNCTELLWFERCLHYWIQKVWDIWKTYSWIGRRWFHSKSLLRLRYLMTSTHTAHLRAGFSCGHKLLYWESPKSMIDAVLIFLPRLIQSTPRSPSCIWAKLTSVMFKQAPHHWQGFLRDHHGTYSYSYQCPNASSQKPGGYYWTGTRETGPQISAQ